MTSKSIDHLVASYTSKEQELAELGAIIRSSEQKIVVVFVDLAGSTALKVTVKADEWLGYVHTFIAAISKHANSSGGTIVKRIGDELMLTFESVADGEQFIDSVRADELLAKPYRFKIAADTGPAYHFKFEAPLADDPYGTVVDRCARIANIAQAGLDFCSSAYAAEVEPERYESVGMFPLKGLAETEEIFVRKIAPHPELEEYLRPLLEDLNNPRVDHSGFRYMARSFTTSDLTNFSRARARPFLVRELVNTPRLPYSLAQFEQVLKALPNIQEASDYLGYIVEWDVVFESYTRMNFEQILAYVCRDQEEISLKSVSLLLPRNMMDAVRMLEKGSRIRVRGILTEIGFLGIQLNYVDLMLLD